MNGERSTTVANGRFNNVLSPNHSPTKILTSKGNSRPPPPPVRPRPQRVRPTGVGRVPLQNPQISIEDSDNPCSPLSPPKSPPYDRLASPTISTDEEPSITNDIHSAPNSPYKQASARGQPDVSSGKGVSSPQHLTVKSVNLKSNSLPLGVAMADMAGNLSSRSPSESDISDDEAESSPQRGHHHGHVHNGHENHHHHHLHHHHHIASVRKKRSETLDSLYSESNSDSSSEDDKMPPILQSIPDDPYDDVFQDVEIDMGSEVDSKLTDWAFNVFVPACCTLLGRCAKMKAEKDKEGSSDRVPASPGTIETLSDCIQSDLRNLSNTINYFCTEQQRLSCLLKAKISASISADRMSKIAIDRASTLQARQTSSNTSSFSDTSSGASGYDSHDSTADRSYAVKILRSVSQSLIAPLLHEAEDGFTDELYKSVIQALQKISWKVEACLTFNDPSKDNEIHTKIFNSERAPTIRSMMIGALPPEEPKLYASATNASRSNSVSSPRQKAESSSSLSPVDRPDVSRIIRRTPSGRRRPEGTIFDERMLPDSLKAVGGGSSAASNEGAKGVVGGDGDKTPLVARSVETIPTIPHRARTATTSELEMSPSRRGRFITQTSTERATHYSDDFDEDFSQHYFRPKAARRTTISLSRKEVTKLGLTVAKRVEESIIPEVSSICESNEGDLHNPATVLTEDDIRQRLHDTLTKEFDQINQHSKSHSYFDRVRSASMSDLLEDNFDSNTPPRRHDSFQGLPEAHPLDSRTGSVGTLDSNDDIISISSARIEQNYVPAYHQRTTSSMDTSCESEWVFINRPDIATAKDPRFNLPRQSSVQSEPATPLKRDKKLKHKSKSMDKVKRTFTSSINTSGKFTNKLKKTAQALRRGSIVSAKPKKFERERVKSMDLLNEMGSSELEQVSPVKVHPKNSRSEPPSPLPTKVHKSDSMPPSVAKKHKSLKRFVSKKKSFGSKDTKSLGRKGKSEFLQNYETEMERECRLSFTESIENYSKIAVKPKAREGEEQLLITVEIPGRHSMSKKEKKRSSIISIGGDHWYEIVITTNMKQFSRHHYTILRTLKQILTLYDSVFNHSAGSQFPDRPDKKAAVKKQRQQIEDFIRYIAYHQQLRSSQVFIDFLMPDEQEFGASLTDGSEVNFELLMTFYTPDVYNGPGEPGSCHQIAVVSDDSSIAVSPSPPSSRKHSLTQKRGTMHLVKGKEENSTFVIREEGHDALIVSSEDDRYVVVAGTFEKLVEQLACEEKPDPRFVMTFLLGYRHFSTASELLTILLRRFHMAVPPDATEEELAYAEKWRYVIQLRVLDILTYWMKKCWPDFYRSDVLLSRVRDFIERLKSSKDTNFQMAGTNLDKVIEDKLSSSEQYAYPPSESHSPSSSTPTTPVQSHPRPLTPSLSPSPLRPPGDATPSSPSKRRTSRGHSSSSIDLSTFTAIQVARQLTLIELDMLKAIETHELVVYMWEANSPENKPYRKNVDAFIDRFNEVSYWVASEICSISDPRARGALIEKFIEVAKHCHEYKNFSTTISIVSGLSLGAIKRLKRSWEHVGEKSLKAFHKLQPIMRPANSHAQYRKVLSGVHRRDPCIPYFGVYIRDLTLFNIGNEKTLKNGLLNFSKIRTMVLKFEELKKYQRSKYFFPVEDKIRDFCQNLWCMSESSLYEASETVEPRDPPPPAPPEETDV